MRRTSWLAAGVAMGVVALAGCAGQQPPLPVAGTADRSQLANWQAQTAETVDRLLTKSGSAVTIIQLSGQPRPTEAMAAGLALRLAGQDVAVTPPPVGKDGLYAVEGADPLFVTWLVARAHPSELRRGEVLRAAKLRMASLERSLNAGDVNAAGAYLTGRDLYQVLNATPPALTPVPSACRRVATALTEGDVIAVSTWSEIASLSRQSCPESSIAGSVRLARERLSVTDVAIGPYTAAQLWAGARLLRAAGQGDAVPTFCPALLAEEQEVRIARDTLTYLACADAVTAGGQRPELSGDVGRWLDTFVRTGGRLPDQQTVDAMGKLYETQILRLLRFPPAVITKSRAGAATAKGGDLEGGLLAAFVQGRLPSSELPTTATKSAVVLSAASVLGGASCPRDAIRQFTAAEAVAGPDADALFREAVVAKALERCGGKAGAWTRSVLKRLGPAERSLHNDLIGWWKAQEARCLLTGRPSLSESAALRLLPDYSLTNPKFDLTLDTLYSAVRLSEIATAGCARPFWDVTAG